MIKIMEAKKELTKALAMEEQEQKDQPKKWKEEEN